MIINQISMRNKIVVKAQNYCVLFVILLGMSCANDNPNQAKHNEFMLEDLRIHSIYNNQNEFYDTIHIAFDSLNRLVSISKYKSGDVSKRYYFDYVSTIDTSGIVIISSLLNNNYHGKTIVYNTSDILIQEIIYKNDKYYFGKYFAKDSVIDELVYFIESPRNNTIGRYGIDEKRIPVDSKSDNFYIVQANDTTFKDWKNKGEIILLNNYRVNQAYLAINRDTFYFNDKKLEIEFDAEELGVSRHFGEIEVTIDTVVNGDSLTASANYPFYYEFQVIDLYDYILPFYEERNNFLYAIDTMPEVQRILNLKEY